MSDPLHKTTQSQGAAKEIRASDETLLQEIRENFDLDTDAFADIRSEGSTDIQYIANDPWPAAEKTSRRENQRPLVAIDILNQYTNLVVNEVRQHPREVKVSPAGYGATAKLAEFRENRIRAIQYKSDAQAAYITAMENMCQRSYGFFRISLRYVSETSFDQEICIKRIPNPDAILFDNACKELDCSDAQRCFVLDQTPVKDFKREYPNAAITDFSGQIAKQYPRWIKDNMIQLAEYWRVEQKDDMVVQFHDPKAGILSEALSRLPGAEIKGDTLIFGAMRLEILDRRETRIPSIVQYITNGVEILKRNKWLGKWIPIVPMFGKELYVEQPGGSKRLLLSLIRNARDAQMGYNYARTCEVEAVGMVPRTNYLAIEGQFEGHEQEVADANKVPKAFLYYKAWMPDGPTPAQPLPPPIREPFDPPVQNLELCADSFAKSAQTAIGMYNSSVGKNDTNVKSGKAIQELDEQSDLGSFHFIANYNRGITAGGRIINDLISKIEISERQVSIRKQDGTEALPTINTQEPYTDDATGEQHHYPMQLGEYDVTIGVGPNEDAQRDQASDFVETLVEELAGLPIDPAKKEAILAQLVKSKQMGPIGDQIVDILQPPAGDPQQLQASLQQMQGEVQKLQQENVALHAERAAKIVEQQTKIHVEGMRGQNQLDLSTQKLIVDLIKAELASKSRSTDLIAEQDADREKTVLGLQHESTLQHSEQAHEVAHSAVEHNRAKELADKQATNAALAQAADHAQQSMLAQQAAENQPQAGQ